jgi:hypothetical protein
MTREDQIIESDSQICVGGEWFNLHPDADSDDPATVWKLAGWRHDYLASRQTQTIVGKPA